MSANRNTVTNLSATAMQARGLSSMPTTNVRLNCNPLNHGNNWIHFLQQLDNLLPQESIKMLLLPHKLQEMER